ncbi:hypothetical protein GCM10009785_25950 [Brooklawnia cerclae]|uniref:Histidine kinase n=1 Tax=Brooklawnia cerclae TaxID=349934 RepID=A0ABX0SHF7_9ACTN|nr:hypothetical protein [Brooklawnia cerclae]NIH57400.1 hypothetical protein [Brooklawnia cerclae]
MDLSPYVDQLRGELVSAAHLGGQEAVAAAERLVASLDPAMRLTMLDVLTAAADAITTEMVPGSVEVRLHGRDVGFVVTPPTLEQSLPPTPPPPPVASTMRHDESDEASARVNFRPPESLKARIEQAAKAEGLSVNAWLVRICTQALAGSTRATRTSDELGLGNHLSGWLR